MECRRRTTRGSTHRFVSSSPDTRHLLGQNLPILNSGSAKFLVRGNRLLINFVDQTDQGQYVCHAVNDYDRQGQRAEYDLRVLIPPELHPIAPLDIRLDENHSPQQATFTCRLLRGSPAGLTLQWIWPAHPFLEVTLPFAVKRVASHGVLL